MTADQCSLGLALFGLDNGVHLKPQDPMTAWGAKTGRAYNRRFTRFWRQFEGQDLGDGTVVHSVGREIAPGQKADLVMIHHGKKEIVITDWTGSYSARHQAKGKGYQAALEQKYPGYKVEYEEIYWGGKEARIEALGSDGVKYYPADTRPGS